MTKKQLKDKLDMFIKEHSPDEFDTTFSLVGFFLKHQPRLNGGQLYKLIDAIKGWWWAGKSPMSESAILPSMDTKYVTHEFVQIHACSGANWGVTKYNVFEKMFDLSFKYNIVAVKQKPGEFDIWLKESEDHQTNISGEVVEKIAKCLEF